MTRLNWSSATSRIFETGLDRGVLYPKDAPAVPWYGLTNVSEDGAEESKVYYMDGRPYLIVPQPKEYVATIKAYTYPDEFASLMGLEEATEGFYVDSQQGDSFNFSYRTLIGNAIEGETAGYKIHIVYNAVVATDSKEFASVGSSIDPSEFSWNIKAWPMPIAGYRSSAHFVIDTRHVDEVKMAEIESLLYGSDENDAEAPDPNTILDLLNYNGVLNVIDNEDGTWTVSGPSDLVKVFADGNFELNEVVATFFADGQYAFTEYYIPPEPEPGTGTDTPPTEIDGGTSSSGGETAYDGGTPGSTDTLVYDGGTP